MSYDIYIGNAELESEWIGEYGPRAEWVVLPIERDDAPFKPDLTGRSNGCHPGYSQWSEFAREASLHALFFDKEDGLLAQHPGIVPLTAAHLACVDAARTAYVAKYPDHHPGACEHCNIFNQERALLEHDPLADFNLYRLEWLAWWMRWALDNCERPAVMNR